MPLKIPSGYATLKPTDIMSKGDKWFSSLPQKPKFLPTRPSHWGFAVGPGRFVIRKLTK